MAYNFESGLYFTQIMECAQLAIASVQQQESFNHFQGLHGRNTCQESACNELLEFSVNLCSSYKYYALYPETKQLFDEFCKMFHNDEDEVDSITFERFSHVINSSALAIHPEVKTEFIRLVSAIHANKLAERRVQNLIAQQRFRVLHQLLENLRPIAKKQNILNKHMTSLEYLARKFALDWNNKCNNFSRSTALSKDDERYFRMNLRCRIINYLRKVFPTLEPSTRMLILKRFEKANSIFHMLPLIGYRFLISENYPPDNCIFKNTNSCCMLKNYADKISFASVKATNLLGVEFAISGVTPFVYHACDVYNDVTMKKSRMSYTENFGH